MSILLRYNGKKDKSFDNQGNLKVGDIVRCSRVNNSFAHAPATIYYNKDISSNKFEFAGDLNTFDYVKQEETSNGII